MLEWCVGSFWVRPSASGLARHAGNVVVYQRALEGKPRGGFRAHGHDRKVARSARPIRQGAAQEILEHHGMTVEGSITQCAISKIPFKGRRKSAAGRNRRQSLRNEMCQDHYATNRFLGRVCNPHLDLLCAPRPRRADGGQADHDRDRQAMAEQFDHDGPSRGSKGASGAVPRRRSLARSAMATIAALIGPVGMVGRIEPSTI